jgi:hypothetical protein
MSIEKKSLISNRTATKKAIVTKPEVTNVAPARLARPSKVRVHVANVRPPKVANFSRIKY